MTLTRRTGLRRRKGLRKVSARKPLTKALDRLTKDVMLVQRGNRCLRCGSQPVQAAHIMPKGQYPHLRWRPDNVIPLCWRCHMTFWHKNPVEAGFWIVSVLGVAEMDRLRMLATGPHGKADRMATLLWLKETLRRAAGRPISAPATVGPSGDGIGPVRAKAAKDAG